MWLHWNNNRRNIWFQEVFVSGSLIVCCFLLSICNMITMILQIMFSQCWSAEFIRCLCSRQAGSLLTICLQPCVTLVKKTAFTLLYCYLSWTCCQGILLCLTICSNLTYISTKQCVYFKLFGKRCLFEMEPRVESLGTKRDTKYQRWFLGFVVMWSIF